MSRQSEERNREKFAEKMRQKSLAARTAKLGAKKPTDGKTPESSAEGKPQG